MDLRKKIGGMAESELNQLIDDLKIDDLLDKALDKLKVEAKKYLNDEIKLKIKANYIDKLDGEDDIKDV